MPKLILLFLLSLLASIVSIAQNSKFDSLSRVLAVSKEDTNKVNLYRAVGISIIYQNAPSSIPYFLKGAKLAEKLNFDPGIERCYAAASLAYSLNADYDSSLIYIDIAIPYALKVGNPRRLALVYLNRADVYVNLQKFSSAIRNCDTAILYAEQAGSKDGLGRIYSILGGVYQTQKQYKEAISFYNKAGDYFEQVNNKQMVAMTYSDMAQLHLDTNEPDKAIPLLIKSISIGDSLNDVENCSGYRNSLAQAYIVKNRYAEAEVQAKLGLRDAQQTGNRKQQAMIYEVLSGMYFQQKNYSKAIEEEMKAYEILKEEKDLMREQTSAANLAEAYFKSGNSSQAYQFLKISRDLNDSLIKQQFNNETAQLQTNFQVTQKDKEILLLNKENELKQQRLQKQRLLMWGAASLALLALGAIWLLMNRNKLRQRMKELELRNRIAADLHDEVGSSLSSIHLLSQMAFQQRNDAAPGDILSKMSSISKETMDKMGDIVWTIKPDESGNGSLKQRMERFAYEIGGSKNIEVSMQMEEPENATLTMEQRKNIYLIFKEALNNAVKYSDSKRIIVSVNTQNKELLLIVKDEGKGFDYSSVKKGNGLDNIKNRANELGGKVEISSTNNQGTVIKLHVPVKG